MSDHDLVQTAYGIISKHEQSIRDAPGPYTLFELLQGMLEHAPSDEGKRYVATSIIHAESESEISCTRTEAGVGSSYDAMVDLAQGWADKLLLPSTFPSSLSQATISY